MEKKCPRNKEEGVPRVDRFHASCERLKRLDLKELLEREYGLSFHREGNSYVALSPFQSETRPSFYVRRLDDGHWVFKDHSADAGGTIFDFVRRREGLDSFAEAYQRATLLAEETGMATADPVVDPEPPNSGPPDLEWLLERFRQADGSICGEYLARRGVAASLIDRLLASGTVTLNAYRGHSHCCFAVRDRSGRLRGLFNRRIDGDGKFLLGERTVFSLDWERLAQARSVFVCEGIIDYLSLKTLEGADAVGVALLGGHVDGELRGLLPESELIAAFDDDEAGRKAGERLRTLFPDRVVKDYDLLGHHDPNELLTAGGRGGETSKGSHKLTPELRARIAFDSRPSREIAAELGLHHSTVCEIREDAQRILRDTWSRRRPGPKPAPPEDGRMAAARDEADALREKVDLGRMRNDWLELQLKWHRRREEEERRRGATQKKTTEKRRPQAKRRKKKRRK